MKIEDIAKLLELAGKALLAMPAILYVLGFCMVTFHLARYHIMQFDLSRSQYLFSAVIILLPLIVFSLLLPAIMNLLDLVRYACTSTYEQKRIKAKNIGVYLAAFITMLMLIYISFVPLFGEELGSIPRLWNFIRAHFKELLLYPWILVILIKGIWDLLKKLQAGKPEFYSNWQDSVKIATFYKNLRESYIVLLFFFAFFLIYFGSFIVSVFPEIPAEIGGGEPLNVIITSKDSQPMPRYLEECSFEAKEKQKYHKLILETSSSYYFLCEKELKAIQVPKDIIESVSFVKY